MGKVIRVDLTGVESFQKASEGEHICKIAAADLQQSQGGNDMIVVQFEVTRGDDKGARVFENYPLSDNALWKLKGLLQAIGMKADGKVQLDLDKLIGKVCIVNVIHEEYNGKIRSKADYVKKYSAAEDDVDTEDDEDEEDLPFAEEAEKKEKKSKPAKKEKAPINPPADEDEEESDDDWDEDEDEEEEEKPAPKKKDKPKKEEKPAKKEAKKSKSKDEDEDDDWDDDDWDE